MKFPILLPNVFNHPFTYESDIKLKVGDFVEVPFGKTKITGVVWNEFEKNNSKKFKIKKVINKLDIPSLKKNTLDFLNWFSEYNIVPKGMALKLVLVGGKELKSIDKKFYDNLTFNCHENLIELTKHVVYDETNDNIRFIFGTNNQQINGPIIDKDGILLE